MIWTRVPEFQNNISMSIWRKNSSLCFGEEWTFMRKELRMVITIHNVIIVGIMRNVQNKEMKKCIAKIVNINVGQN